MKKSELHSIVRECLKEAILKEAQRKVSMPVLKHGSLEQYAARKLSLDDELPNRIDYYPKYLPNIRPGLNKPDERSTQQVTQSSLDDLGKITVDGVPLSSLYDFKLELSSHNPHGWGAPNWKWYMVGTLKKKLSMTELKNVVKAVLLEQLNEGMPEFPSGGKQMVFRVNDPVKVWRVSGNAQPTNAYYGNAQISQAPHEAITLPVGTELHWGAMGVFSVVNGQVKDKILLFEPKHPFEKSYGNYKDLWFKHNVEKGMLEFLGEKNTGLRYDVTYEKE